MRVALVDFGASVKDYTNYLADALTEQKNTEVVLFSKAEAQCNAVIKNHKKTYANILAYEVKIFRFFYMCLELIKLAIYVRKHRIAVVHLQWVEVFFFYWLFLKTLPQGVVSVYTCHNTTPFHGIASFKARVQGAGFIGFLKSVDRIIVHTQYSRRKLLADGFTRNVHLIPFGPHWFKSNDIAIPEWIRNNVSGDTAENIRVLMFGVISSYKGFPTAIEALREVLPSATNLCVIVAGRIGHDGDKIAKEFLQLSKEYPKNVRCKFEFISENDANHLFRMADCVLAPYEHIDQSAVVTAAIHYAVPVLASDLDGFAETITHGVNGFLFKRGDSTALADLLRRINASPGLISTAKRGMKKYSKNFPSWEKIAETHTNVYRVKC